MPVDIRERIRQRVEGKPPLLMGDDVPEVYRKLGVDKWRPASFEDPDYIRHRIKQKVEGGGVQRVSPAMDPEMLKAAKLAVSGVQPQGVTDTGIVSVPVIEPIRHKPKEKVKPQPREYEGFWNEMGRSLVGGGLNVAAGGLGTLAGVSEGAIWDADQIEEWAQKLHDKARRPEFAPAEGGGWKGFVANAVGSTLPFMGAAAISVVATGTPMAAFGTAFAVEGDMAYRDAIGAGATQDEASLERLIVGTINGAIEQMQINRLFRFAGSGKAISQTIAKAARDKAWKKLVGKAGKLTLEGIKHAINEGLEEALQETVSQTVPALHGRKLPPPSELLKRVGMAGVGGAVAGGLLGAGGMIVMPGGVSQAETAVEEKPVAPIRETMAGEKRGPRPVDDYRQAIREKIRVEKEQATAMEAEQAAHMEAIAAETEKAEKPVIEEKQAIRPISEAPVGPPQPKVEAEGIKVPPKPTEAKKPAKPEAPPPDFKKWDLHDWIVARNNELRQGEKIESPQERIDAVTGIVEKYKNLKSKIPESKHWITSDTFAARIRVEAKRELEPPAKPEVPAVEEKPVTPKEVQAKIEEAEAETDVEATGISAKRRKRLIKDTRQQLRETGPFEAAEEGFSQMYGQIGPGYYFVPADLREEVESVIGKRRGFPTKLQAMFVFDKHETKIVKTPEGSEEIHPQPYDEVAVDAGAVKQGDWMDPAEFARRVQSAVEGNLEAEILQKMDAESQDPDVQMHMEKLRMLESGATAAEMDDMIREWAEHYGIDDEILIHEWVGAEPLKLKQIKEIKDPAEQERQLDILAEHHIRAEERTAAARTVNEILGKNDVVGVEVEKVEEIEDREEVIPFERRGRPTGAAVITPAGREVVLLAYGADARTGYHEGYHILRRRLSGRDINILEKQFKTEELEAAAFANYVRDQKAPTTMIGHIWKKLLAVLKNIRSALTAKGYRQVSDIFGELAEGRARMEAGPVRGFKTAYERDMLGQERIPTVPQRLPFAERKKNIERVEREEKAEPEEKVERATKTKRDLFDTPYNAGYKGKQAELGFGEAYKKWHAKGKVKIKAALVKAVNEQIQKSMKPRSNSVFTTPERIAMDLSYKPGVADLFYNPGRPLAEVQEAFAQLVKGGPLFDIRYEREPIFFSKLERLVGEKMPNAMDRGSFRAWAKKNGIKDEELKWTGVEEFLNTHGKPTKQQIVDTIAANNIQVEEVEKGPDRVADFTTAEHQRLSELLKEVDYLGFDAWTEAKNAILEHSDWTTRWDVEGSPELVKLGNKYREKHFEAKKQITKFHQYTLPGGENYRELLLRMPVRDKGVQIIAKQGGWVVRWAGKDSELYKSKGEALKAVFNIRQARARSGAVSEYKSGHWEETNVLAHVRFNDRTDAQGKKVLFIEELQSDWHQKGRKQGYRTKPDTVGWTAEMTLNKPGNRVFAVRTADGREVGEYGAQTAKEAIERAGSVFGLHGVVPDAPFKKTWHELALKRMLRYAAENGYDKLAWTSGEQQAERYDLSRHVEAIYHLDEGDGKYSVAARSKVTDEIAFNRAGIKKDSLSNLVGKEMADKITKGTGTTVQGGPFGNWKAITGLDLKVGGEGMKAFYDRMIPQFLAKYAKKWGSKVGTTKVDTTVTKDEDLKKLEGLRGKITVPALDITPTMKQSVMAGQVMYETTADRLRRETMERSRKKARAGRVAAEKGRLKDRAGLKKKASRARLKIQIDPSKTPFLTRDLVPIPKEMQKYVTAVGEEKGGVPNPELTERWFEENIKDIKTGVLERAHRTGSEGFKAAEKLFAVISTRLYNIHPELFRRIRRYIFNTHTRTADMVAACDPFLKGMRKMNKKDYAQIDKALKNGVQWKVDEFVQAYGLQAEYNAASDVLEEIWSAFDKVGGDIGHRKFYWPREVEDVQGFVKYWQGTEMWSMFEEAIKRKAKQAGRQVQDLTPSEKAQVINTLLRGFRTQALTLTAPGAVKERTVPVVDAAINRFYYDSRTALIRYIHAMNTNIAQREFFGRETRLIQQLRKLQSSRLTRLIKLKRKQGIKPGLTEPTYKEHISTMAEAWRAGQERLLRLQTRDLTETIGGWLKDLKDADQIRPQQEREIQQLLTAVFKPKGMSANMSVISAGIYLDTLNSVVQAATQLDEFAYSFYRSPARSIPTAIRTAIAHLPIISRWTTGLSRVKPADIGIMHIGTEFEQVTLREAGKKGPGQLVKTGLSYMLRLTGLEQIDRLNKENYINTVLSKYQAQARRKNLNATFLNRIRRVFGDNYKGVLEDLRRPIKSLDDVSDDVKYLLFNEVLDIQPLAITELPEGYARGGNLRILYTLKSFYIRRIDFMRNECFKLMKSRKTFHVGFSRLVWFAFSFALLGVPTDWIKDFIKGRKFDLIDSVVDGMLKMAFFSKYQAWRTREVGLGSAVLEGWRPPTKAIDAASKDVWNIAKGKDRGFELWRSVPLVGELYYWWFGRGREKIERKQGVKKNPFEGT